MKTTITEEQKIHEEWYKEARKMTMEKLPVFLKKLMNDYNHDYGTICHALAAGAIATIWAMDRTVQGSITGFQAGCVMWSFIQYWNHENNQCGLKLIDYDKLLYPQYEDHFDKIISPDTWEQIKKTALQKIKDKDEFVHPDVLAHWQSIVNDNIPFGFRVKQNS